MYLDLVAALMIVLGFYFGYQRGLIKTLFDTASLFVGIIAALKLSPIVINVIKSSLNLAPSLAFILGIIITLLLTMILIRFIGRKLEDLFEAANINFINKLNGGVLQALFFAIILSYGIGLLDKVNVIKPETKSASISYPFLTKLPDASQKMFSSLKPVFATFWQSTMEAMDSVKSEAEKTRVNESE